MAKKRMNIVYGEKYGDVNDPKTAWKRCGTLFTDEDTGRMSIKLDMIPLGKNFDGWLSVFELRESDNAGGGQSQAAAAGPTDAPPIRDLDTPPNEQINLDDIPF